MTEHRRYSRTPIHAPLLFAVKGETDQREGVGRDISLGGMFIETAVPATFGSAVVVHVSLSSSDEILVLPGTVRWIRDGGMGVQFGLLGVRETHVITEIGRVHQR